MLNASSFLVSGKHLTLALSLLSALPGRSQNASPPMPDAPSGSAAPSSGILLHRVEIIDQQGFGQRLIAGSFLAPAAWNAQGFAKWPGKKYVPCKPTPGFLFEAMAADKLTGVQVFPGDSWLWSPNPMLAQQLRQLSQSTHVVTHCEIKPPGTAEAYLREFLRQGGSHIEIQSSGPLPDADQLAQRVQQLNAQARQQMGMRAPVMAIDTARLHLTGDGSGNPSKTPTEGYMETAIVTISHPTPSGMMVQVNVPLIINKFTPKGELSQWNKLLTSIADSATANAEWQQRVDNFQAGLQRIQNNIDQNDRQTANNISHIQQDANNYAYNKIRSVQTNSQGAIDKSSNAFALSMNDTQEYHDPSTGKTVLGSNQYNHVYSNGQGEFIYSDSPSYDPNATQRGKWQEMQPQQ
jgi:hypothetical protein